jgi:hypothetical protein
MYGPVSHAGHGVSTKLSRLPKRLNSVVRSYHANMVEGGLMQWSRTCHV